MCGERGAVFYRRKRTSSRRSKRRAVKRKGRIRPEGIITAPDVALSGERGGQFYQASQMVDEEQQHAPLLMEHKNAGQMSDDRSGNRYAAIRPVMCV